MNRPFRMFRAFALFGFAVSVPSAMAHADATESRKVTVALPSHLIEKSLEAHTHAPLVERIPESEPSSLLDIPTLARFPAYRSRFLRTLVPDAEYKTWQLVANDGAREVVAQSLRRCLSAGEENTEPWPAAVLRAARNQVRIDFTPGEIRMRFARPLGPLPELLGGCMAYGAGTGGQRTGRFVEKGPARLEALSRTEDGGPALQNIEFQTQSGGADVFAGEMRRKDDSLRYHSRRNLLFVLRNQNHRGVGVWQFEDENARDRFLQAMGPETLLEAFAGGNGHAVRRLMPSRWEAVAGPRHRSATRPMPPLRLETLVPGARVVRIQVPLEDELAWATAERIAVLMRSVGARGVVLPNNMDENNVHELALLRWHPESEDDALSMLALAGRHPSLSREEYRVLLQDPRFLSADNSQREAAAAALERAWLTSGRVIPLLVSEPWVAIPPTLRGVHMRPDGVPIFEQAYWWRD